MPARPAQARDDSTLRSAPVRAWFAERFPGGPTPAQALAWPAIAGGDHTLLVSPTGTGKTLAAFLAILDRLAAEHERGELDQGLRCLYVSPLRSLGYDIETNLREPTEGLARQLGLEKSPIRVGVRTGDTPAHRRKALREKPPHLLITTPESLALMLSQASWGGVWKTLEYLIVDEVHSLVPTKRGADLAVSLERLAAQADRDPIRVGLSATCRPTTPAERFLAGQGRSCKALVAPPPDGKAGPQIDVESLLEPDEAAYRPLTYRRLLKRLQSAIGENRTTVVFANTRAFTERVTHDLREELGEEAVAAHHSALDARRRREVEGALKAGALRGVVTSTSLELGVDIGTSDLAVMIGLPGSVSRCLQRAGRAGHSVGSRTRGLILASTSSELAGAVVTADAARRGQVEPLRMIGAPLDVLCQQLLGIACAGEGDEDEAFELVRRAAPMAELARADFDACLDFLAGQLASPAGAYEPEPGSTPKFTAPRIWKIKGKFGVRNGRVARWFRSNVGTITAEESVRVLADGQPVGTLEGAYAERLQKGDRFLLDGRAFEFARLEGLVVHAKAAGGESNLPRWSSDRQSLSAELALALAAFRDQAASILADGPEGLREWLVSDYDLDPPAASVLVDLLLAQQALSEIPAPGTLLVEEYPAPDGWTYAFHAPLGRAACEAAGRAVGARLGGVGGRNVQLVAADLGWTLTLPDDLAIDMPKLQQAIDPDGFAEAVLKGVDRGELMARRFRHVASTALMVLRKPEGGRTRVGGLLWVSQRLFPLVKAACPGHPLLKETRREVLDDLLDTPTALAWLSTRPPIRFRSLEGASPFTAAWIDQGGPEALRFEDPAESLRRLHQRLTTGRE